MLRQTIFQGQLAKLTSIAQNKSMSLNNNARLLLTKVGNDLSAMSSNGRSKHDVCIR